jgi:ABC-2 type transport system permease protein
MLSSISPLEMLAGKAIGLGAAGLLQLAIWLLAGNLLLGVAGSALSLPAGFSLGTSAIAGGLLFFLLGYALYAALIAGLGALAPSLRDASQATIIVYIPLMVPLWLINSIMMQPNGAVAVALSIIPFTSPVVMAARLVRVSPPLWQVVLAAALLLVTAYGTLRLVARLFRAQTLLSGQPVSIANLRAALRQS